MVGNSAIVMLVSFKKRMGAVATVAWNHREEEGILQFRVTKRSTKLRRLSKTTRRSRVHVQTVGLNAETKKCRHRADGEKCLLTFLFIGRFYDSGTACGAPRFGDAGPGSPIRGQHETERSWQSREERS
jgi:hypothetical protein